jgi:hypothetical protein
VIRSLGNPQPLFPEGTALSKQAQLGMAPGEVSTGDHRGQVDLTEALVAPHITEGPHDWSVIVYGPTIVALGLMGYAQGTVRYRLQDGISARRGEREGVLAKGDGLVICTSLIEMEGQKVRDLSQATRVVEGHRKGLGLAQARQDAPRITRRQEGIMQDEPEIDGLLTLITCLRQMWEGTECLLEIPRSLAVGRLRYGLVPSLSAVRQGFVPHLTPAGHGARGARHVRRGGSR